MSALVTPAEPNAMPRTEESSIIIFRILFYTHHGTRDADCCAAARRPASATTP